mgnify:CR=1 FL=1
MEFVASAAFGLEGLVKDELRALGFDAKAGQGGARFEADLEGAFLANLRLACADRLDAAVARMAALSEQADSTDMVAADLDFHRALVEAAGSERLSRIHETVVVETSMCLRAMSSTYGPAEDRVTEHRELADAIRAGELVPAITALQAHMSDGLQRLTATAATSPE